MYGGIYNSAFKRQFNFPYLLTDSLIFKKQETDFKVIFFN